MTRHSFGGDWTRVKLDTLEKYLDIYTTAMKNQRSNFHYVDAFAGTGQRDGEDDPTHSLIKEIETLKGSATRALECKHPFDHYHFNDTNPHHVKALRELAAQHPDKNVNVTQEDANVFVQQFCRDMRPMDRAIIFLDPYSSELEWSTLKAIRKTEKVDLWLLFPISTLLRVTPRNGPRDEWGGAIERMLGTSDWKELYEEQPLTMDLFGEHREEVRRQDYKKVVDFVTTHLRRLFPFVDDPFHLDRQGRLLFLLYFCVSNPSPAALALARNISAPIRKSRK